MPNHNANGVGQMDLGKKWKDVGDNDVTKEKSDLEQIDAKQIKAHVSQEKCKKGICFLIMAEAIRKGRVITDADHA